MADLATNTKFVRTASTNPRSSNGEPDGADGEDDAVEEAEEEFTGDADNTDEDLFANRGRRYSPHMTHRMRTKSKLRMPSHHRPWKTNSGRLTSRACSQLA